MTVRLSDLPGGQPYGKIKASVIDRKQLAAQFGVDSSQPASTPPGGQMAHHRQSLPQATPIPQVESWGDSQENRHETDDTSQYCSNSAGAVDLTPKG